MPTYQEQLESEEWKSRRLEILNLDQFKCKVCLNKKIIETAICTSAAFSHNDNRFNLFKVSDPTLTIFLPEEQSNHLREIKVYYALENEVLKLIGARIRNKYDDDLQTQQDNYCKIEVINEVLRPLKDSKTEEQYEDLKSALFIASGGSTIVEDIPIDYTSFVWKSVPGLHVHHKYYLENCLAWEYPDDALMTLCKICHEDLHSKEKIPIFNELGIQTNL